MSNILQRVYGIGQSTTGTTKTASATPPAAPPAAEQQQLDLTQISAADFIALLEQQEQQTAATTTSALAGGQATEPDLTQMSAEELIALAQQPEATEPDPAEKLAQSGELAYWDAIGRQMARSFVDESTKLAASNELPDTIAVADLSAEQLLALVNSGEYELVVPETQQQAQTPPAPTADAEKVARFESAKGAVRNFLSKAKEGAGHVAGRAMYETSRAVGGDKGAIARVGGAAAAGAAGTAGAAAGAHHMLKKKGK